jgi:hypothetical protein
VGERAKIKGGLSIYTETMVTGNDNHIEYWESYPLNLKKLPLKLFFSSLFHQEYNFETSNQNSKRISSPYLDKATPTGYFLVSRELKSKSQPISDPVSSLVNSTGISLGQQFYLLFLIEIPTKCDELEN